MPGRRVPKLMPYNHAEAHSPFKMTLTTGARLGVYEIVGLLGAGGMGEVYRARDPRLGRDVAIKVLPAGIADPERLARFEQEARAAAALNHPNILALYDIGSHDDAPYLVTELLEGEALRERLTSGPLPVRKAVEYAVQIAHGLAAAHERGIVHRDLKPENIFLTADGHVKILDFGLAKLTQVETTGVAASVLPTTPPNTQAGVVLGTVGYMAPEQVRGLVADHRADIFAFGATLYEMLSGQRAFHGDTAMDSMMAIVKDDPAELPAAERHIPPGLARIVDRCLEKSPSARFQSTRDLGFALEGLSSHSEERVAVAGSLPRARRERVAWLTAAIALLIALGAGVTSYLARGRSVTGVPEMRLQVVTPPNANDAAFALSPDGTKLVFMAGGRLWLRALQSETPQPLAGTEAVGAPNGGPFWSPDGSAIGFFASNQLKRLDLESGLVQVLASAANPIGGTWSPDGTILFAPSPASPLVRVSAAGRATADATTLSAGHVGHRFPQFLPDGRRFLFQVLGNAEQRGVYLGSLDSADTRKLMTTETPVVFGSPDRLFLVDQGALLAQRLNLDTLDLVGEPQQVAGSVVVVSGSFNAVAMTVSASGPIAYRLNGQTRQLTWVDRAGRHIGTVAEPDAATPAFGRLSPDNRTLAVSRRTGGNQDVWLVDLMRGAFRRLTFDAVRDTGPVWSPDGTRIVFGSERSGVYDLFEGAVDGTGAEQPVLSSLQPKLASDWSLDGRFLAYDLQGAGVERDVWAMPLEGDRKPFAVAQTQSEERGARFSPDTRWVAYQSNETGRSEVYVQPFPGPGGKVQVSTDGGSLPYFRRDGRELFFIGPSNRVMAVPITLGDARATIGTPASLFISPGSGIFDPASDGERFLVDALVEESAPITILLNWAGFRN